MTRTQVSLDDGQMEGLRALAASRATSVSALLREAVQWVLSDAGAGERRRQALEVVGSFSSGRPDTSQAHDHYVRRAYEERLPGR